MMKKYWLPALLVIIMPLSAMPLRPGLEVADEYPFPDNLNTAKRPLRNPGMKMQFNSMDQGFKLLVSGTWKASVVNIQYPDYSSQYPVSDFQNMLFGTWSSGSAHDYYDEVSYSNLDLTGNVYGWYTANNNKSYYGYNQGFERSAELVKEAAQKSDPDVDYSQFDSDDDGYVDLFTVVHSGFGREETGSGSDIHSHHWHLSSASSVGEYVTDDPWPGHPGQFIKIDEYSIDPERSNVSNNGSMITIGVFCHEWGHALGLPDLYDIDYSGSGIGRWGIMAAGSWGGDGASPWRPVQMCAWSKMDLGWITPTTVTENDTLDVVQIETNDFAYQLWTDGNPTSEYFLVANRQKALNDLNLPNSGLMIYHIDEVIIDNNRSSNEVNSGSIYGVAVEQADGFDHLLNGNNQGDAGDPFPGSANNTAFDSTGSDPDSRSNSGDNTHCGVNAISASASTMSAFFYINGEDLTAEFSADPTSGSVPLEVTFTDESTGEPDNWAWDFGDGNTSVEQSPIHTYQDTGNYTVTLVVSNASSVDTMVKPDYITVTEAELTADFTGEPTSGSAPLTVGFTDMSTGEPTEWSWDFGDFRTSTNQNPTHRYDADGQYTVSLTVRNAEGEDTEVKTDYIIVDASAPTAQFSASPTSGDAPLDVTFADESTGDIAFWSWDFGDGNTSTSQSPTHRYTDPGTYTVSLTASNPYGADTETKNDYISVGTVPQPPAADFSATPTSGNAPLTVDFTDLSSGNPTSWSWDFGDGNNSTSQNPSNTYISAGSYDVSLTVTNSDGSDTETKTDYITVTSISPPVAGFTADPSSGYVPFTHRMTVNFTDTSTGTVDS
ncbi:M6 family metalloprotease domain-containing protein, partial [candidate division WOR-3 bacterium]|nr:M6 family metalloprotease domain-containing protein [candidate division WOR-3 bacterium]